MNKNLQKPTDAMLDYVSNAVKVYRKINYDSSFLKYFKYKSFHSSRIMFFTKTF